MSEFRLPPELYPNSMRVLYWNPDFQSSGFDDQPKSISHSNIIDDSSGIYHIDAYSDSSRGYADDARWQLQSGPTNSQPRQDGDQHVDFEVSQPSCDFTVHSNMNCHMAVSPDNSEHNSIMREQPYNNTTASSPETGCDTQSRSSSRTEPLLMARVAHKRSSDWPSKQPGSQSSRDSLAAANRATHQDVERKYRMNLNEKMAKLRDAVPSLQFVSGRDSSAAIAKHSKVRIG